MVVCLAMDEAVAMAAAVAVRANGMVDIRQVDTSALHQRLREHGA